ncbi:sigma-70 family RNA polymerase sigma factor [Yinghuangia sp. YIM S09857]|uniref:sigma-70 family RNA polymerase sigma factor n=1 Tax=Yinghuangia sp. YIM S09857 TaxID=3436929 RepID=UPI003F53D488
MSVDLEHIRAIDDPFELLRVVTGRLADAQREVTELARLRRGVVQDLHAKGMSYAQIAEAAGLSRGRIHQIRQSGPAPEGAFLGIGGVIVATPLRQDAPGARTVVAVDDVTSGKRLEDLARSLGLDVTSEHVPVSGDLDLNRDGLIAVCGPRMSEDMEATYGRDPILRWEKQGDEPWALRDTRTGVVHRSGMDEDPARSQDVGYLGRLPRPDGEGLVLTIAGIHTPGSLGVVHLLANDLAQLFGRVGTKGFSTLVGVEFDPDTHEPRNVELLTPLYLHDGS